MIKTWKHKGLCALYESDSSSGINPQHELKLSRQLDRLDSATSPQDMNLPGYELHPLKGDRGNEWAVKVSGNWRLTFSFEGENAIKVNYEDYH